METFKNFIIGVFVMAMALVVVFITFMAWPFLIGITSFVLFVAAAFLFLVLIFYVIVLIGHLTRMILSAIKKVPNELPRGK